MERTDARMQFAMQFRMMELILQGTHQILYLSQAKAGVAVGQLMRTFVYLAIKFIYILQHATMR